MSASVDPALLDPNISPAKLVKSSGAGIRRVNNMPLVVSAAVVIVFVLVVAMVAFDRANEQQMAQAETTAVVTKTSTSYADELSARWDPFGLVPAAPAPAPEAVPDAPAMRGEPQLDMNMPPRPDMPTPTASLLPPPSVNPDAERMRMARMQLFDEAVRAGTSLPTGAPRGLGSRPALAHNSSASDRLDDLRRRGTGGEDAAAAYQNRLGQLASPGQGSGAGRTAPAGGGNSRAIPTFDPGSGQDRWALGAEVQAPRTPYELRAGFVIPAMLISGINSDLPGQIVGQVTQNVFDTASSRHLLIPQGSRLVGAYSSDVAFGQRRVLVAWQRIIFPDGKALDIGNMPGADGAGYSGFTGDVNNHIWRVLGSAILMSSVVAGVSLSQDSSASGNDRQRASDALSESLGQVLGNTIAQVVSKNLNIAPTLEIRPGYRFNVVTTKDITFTKPYSAYDY